MLEKEQIEDKIIFMDCSSAPKWELEKVIGVLQSFIEKMEVENKYVYIYAPSVIVNLNCKKI